MGIRTPKTKARTEAVTGLSLLSVEWNSLYSDIRAIEHSFYQRRLRGSWAAWSRPFQRRFGERLSCCNCGTVEYH